MDRPDFNADKFKITRGDGIILSSIGCHQASEIANKAFDEWQSVQRRANIYIEGKGVCDCIVIETGKPVEGDQIKSQ